MDLPLLSLIVFMPLVGVAALLVMPRSWTVEIRTVALATTVATFLASLALCGGFEAGRDGFQFEEGPTVWIGWLGARYHLGVDGLSLWLVLLTTFLSVIAVLCSWREITTHVKQCMVVLLLLETGMVGVFVALDLFLFYVFWEAMLIPMYFLIGVWGGPRRVYAAVKFFLFTMAGSIFMLVAILALHVLHKGQTGVATFDLPALMGTQLPYTAQMWLFAAFALAFAIKVPVWPLHTWLPDAHVEAPTAGSVLLAGVLLKMGTYGFLRFCFPLFPDATRGATEIIVLLAVVSILYGALMALAQTDIKKLVAYSSVSHLGFVMLGMFAMNPQGVQGGILQMVNHGLSTGCLFALVGMIYERRHTRDIAAFGGVARVMPSYATFFMIIMLSAIGLPGLNGFVGEFLVLVGAFKARMVYAVLAAGGIVLSAIYMLWMYQRVMHGPLDKDENRVLTDLTAREWAILVPIALLVVAIGVYPKPFLAAMDESVKALISVVVR
jgi:NADH-quinone oxidoreductase subunit M